MGVKPEFSPEMPIGLKFSILSRAFKSRIDERFKDEGLTAVQASTIRSLSRLSRDLQREVTITDLKEAQKLSHPTMIEIIRKLEAKGFVETSKSNLDKRSRSVKLTSKADEFESSIKITLDNVYDSLCEGIDKTELDQMEQTINKMLINALGGKD